MAVIGSTIAIKNYKLFRYGKLGNKAFRGTFKARIVSINFQLIDSIYNMGYDSPLEEGNLHKHADAELRTLPWASRVLFILCPVWGVSGWSQLQAVLTFLFSGQRPLFLLGAASLLGATASEGH